MTAEFIRTRILANWPNSKLTWEAAQHWESELALMGVQQSDFEQAVRDLAWNGKTLKVGVTFPEVLQAIKRLTGVGQPGEGPEADEVEACVFAVCIRPKDQQEWYQFDLEDGCINRSGGVYWAGDWSATRARPIEDRRLEGFRFARAVAAQMEAYGMPRSSVREVCPGFPRFLSSCLDLTLDEIWPFVGVVQTAISFDADSDPFADEDEGRAAKRMELARIGGLLDAELLKVTQRGAA